MAERRFLERWSARKRAARNAEAKSEPGAAPETASEPVAVVEPEPEPEIDPADLPPLESIKTGVDVQAFLQRGVPKALRQAALRRLWAVDPKISAFREVADYDWDFNAPGYGALAPGDDPRAAAEKLFQAIRRQVVETSGVPAEAPRSDTPAVEAEPVRQHAADPPEALPPEPRLAAPAGEPPAAAAEPHPHPPPQPQPQPQPQPRRRRHGSAMPR